MSALIRCAVLVLFAVSLTSMAVHKYYVAVFQVEYSEKKNELQVTGRIFIDDLEKALDTKYSRKFNLGSSREAANSDAVLKKYFTEKISVKVNGKARVVNFITKETEDDVLVCYFTVPAEKKIKSIEVKNTLLFELFKEQQNIINTKINGNKKSLLLTYDAPNGTLEY
jgi:ABC-type uncharacterized transport system substrate-binding protein